MRPSILGLIAVASLLGCLGGGGSGHVPPDQIVEGRATVLGGEFYTWGNGWGALERRFGELECHYRTKADSDFRSLAMEIASVTEEKLVAHCSLPAFSASEDSVEYWFSFRLDGHRNERSSEVVSVARAPATNR